MTLELLLQVETNTLVLHQIVETNTLELLLQVETSTLDMVLLLLPVETNTLVLHQIAVTSMLEPLLQVVTSMLELHQIVETNTLDMVLLPLPLLPTVVMRLILVTSTEELHLTMMTKVTTVTWTIIAITTTAVVAVVVVAVVLAARTVLPVARTVRCIAVDKVSPPVIMANKSTVPVAQAPGVVNGVELSSATMRRIKMLQSVTRRAATVAVDQSLINVIMVCG